MNLPIQNWLNTQKLSKEALSSFEESFICFKIGAYKASLLFAYLGFMNIIRDRIIMASPPSGITSSHWAGIQAAAKNPEKWEEVVFDAIQQMKPASIFIVSEDIREQMKYWRNRRNDCAHSKQNKIIAAHVESFYAFIESNLGKLAVNGSRQEILQRILEYFNPSLTSPNESITPIIHDLLNALTISEYHPFVTDVISELSQNSAHTFSGIGNPEVIKFLGACFKDGSDELREACKTSLNSDDDLLVDFLQQHPDKVYILQNQHQKIRLIWHDHLFKPMHNDFAILSSMLRASLIPQDQIEEAISLSVKASASRLPSDIDLQTLIQYGYYTVLEKMIVSGKMKDDFYWANDNKDLITKYLSENVISHDVAGAIYNAFNSQHFPWHLAEHLNAFFSQNSAKKVEYLVHTSDTNIGIPSKIHALLSS